jgi:hypothetical protein
LHPAWELDAALDPLRGRASEVLDDAFGPARTENATIGWKDPRLSLLLPFWRTITPISTTIVLVRDPAEVAASLRARNRIEAPQTAMLWLRYLYAATSDDPDHLLVRYHDFFEDLPGTLTNLAAHLGSPPPDANAIAEARAYLDPSLRHHVEPVTDPVDNNPLVALAAAVWKRGSVDLDAFSGIVTEAIRWGWLRPPVDGELLARARAQAVELRDRFRQRRRQERAAQSGPTPGIEQRAQPSPVPGEGSMQPEDVGG